MSLKNMIYKVRTDANLSQAKFAACLGVSSQAVQKWESGESTPGLDKVVQIAQRFGVSLDALVLERDERLNEELHYHKEIKPKYANIPSWESYSSNLLTEYRQSIEEGLDISSYEDLFNAVAKMPRGDQKERIADVLFEIVQDAKICADYVYDEPSDLSAIRTLCKAHSFEKREPDQSTLQDKIHGAWLGRICGCLLGKPVEGIRSHELIPVLKASGNYPMHRYIRSTDITEEMINQYSFPLRGRCYADVVDGMPVDDDTNYVVLAQEVVKRYGREFSSYDMSRAWLAMQPKDAYCTAERVAFCNFVKGYEPPESGRYKNPYREWIGAQIRGDYFGYINPGDPETAAKMAYRDACISHVKNGIYGEMFAAAMIACAAVTDSITDIIRGGLAQIPQSSRLYEMVEKVISDYESGVGAEECMASIHRRFDERNGHDWCHTISNAMIVVAALLYGEGDFGRSICMAVQACFDTDCNGATVGSVLGMRNGTAGIGEEWTAPLRDKLHTSIFGVGTVSVSERAKLTWQHLSKNR
ncbi:MAG: ADP-ribosylglycohydrolase family protein [Clostridia bacterium]|nr:ADP-ribosylglycohydrolase family protein [Clostridia bacterium]